ncbi:MAG: hypothetical protein KQH53_14135 [Desulfarculaceae bacterium]|nr:hypothetical protein [Desulfarculaceae bacterium]
MRLILVSGFLGSGKTTLILQLGKALAAQGRKAAIIVNEIGDIGLDNQLMIRLGLNVYEILGGCVCCTLAGDLPNTLRQLQESYAPDLVLMEPSGAADPQGVMNALEGIPQDLVDQVKRITILDPLRLEGLWAVLQPLIQSTVENCDLALINKSDAASASEMAYARDLLSRHNPAAKAFAVSAQEGLEPAVLEELLS